jgi:hypothetical protein
MSLIKGHWLVLAGGGVVALYTPYALLRPSPVPPPAPVDISTTKVEFRPVPSFDSALRRPIFSPNRVPEGTTDPTFAIAQIPDQAPPQAAVALPKLVGVVLAQNGRGVALVKRADGQTLMLESGQLADGWMLIGLTRVSARFKLGSETQIARLHFSNPSSSGNETSKNEIPLPPKAEVGTPLALPEYSSATPTDASSTGSTQ